MSGVLFFNLDSMASKSTFVFSEEQERPIDQNNYPASCDSGYCVWEKQFNLQWLHSMYNNSSVLKCEVGKEGHLLARE